MPARHHYFLSWVSFFFFLFINVHKFHSFTQKRALQFIYRENEFSHPLLRACMFCFFPQKALTDTLCFLFTRQPGLSHILFFFCFSNLFSFHWHILSGEQIYESTDYAWNETHRNLLPCVNLFVLICHVSKSDIGYLLWF